MWARLESNTIKEILIRPKALTIGGVQYPSNIFSMWSNSELAVIGIVPVEQDNTNLKDKQYYINTAQSYTYNTETGKATASYGTATALPLADSGSGDSLVKGLKSKHKDIINQQAGVILQDTDWMVIRAAEGGTAVPGATTTWRAAVRTKANSMQAQIDGAANVDALAALYIYNSETPPVRPLGEFPTL